MNTHQAMQEGAMDRLRADMAERDSIRDAGISTLGGTMDRLCADLAERDSVHDAGISTLKSAMDRLRADMAERDAELAKRDAARDVDMAKRDKDNTRWLIGMWVAAVIVLGTFLSALITWPP